jgi:hypothetical protein
LAGVPLYRYALCGVNAILQLDFNCRVAIIEQAHCRFRKVTSCVPFPSHPDVRPAECFDEPSPFLARRTRFNEIPHPQAIPGMSGAFVASMTDRRAPEADDLGAVRPQDGNPENRVRLLELPTLCHISTSGGQVRHAGLRFHLIADEGRNEPGLEAFKRPHRNPASSG